MTEYPIIGMSPGNSYFKKEVVKDLLQKVVEKHGKTAVFVADVPAIWTYMALGYPENRARRDKAIPQGNILKNRVRRAMTALGYSDEQVKIVDWDTGVGNNSDYKLEYDKVINLYESNTQFRNATNEATKKVLEDEERVSDLDSATTIAVKYILSEFAFMEFAPKLFGVDRVTYIYHKNWPVYEAYRSGEFDGKKREYLGSETVVTGKESSKLV